MTLDKLENDDKIERFPNKVTESVCKFIEENDLRNKLATLSDIKTVIQYQLILPIYQQVQNELIKSFLISSFNDVDWKFIEEKLNATNTTPSV